MVKRRKDEEERANANRSVIDRATEARRQREAEIAARRQERPNVSTTPEPSSPRESGRRKGGNSQFSGWADDVRSYTPGGRKKRDNTTSKRWARELDSENQRSEQMDMRRREQERARRKEQAEDLSPEKQREEQVKAMREAWRGKDPDASRKVTTDASQTKVPATPLRTSGTSSKPKAEPETPGEFFPTSSEPLPSESLDIVGALTGAKAGMLAGESGPPKTAYQQRQEEKGTIQAEYDSLFDEYSALANTINWGKIGKDYTREDVQRLNEMEIQLGEMKTQLGEYDKNVEWEGRQSLVDERNALWNKKNNYGSFMYSGLTPEEEKRLEELEGLIAQGDAAAGNPEQFYSGVERVEGAVFGGAVEGAANIINAAGTLANAAGYIGEHYGDPRADAGYATDELAASFLADATEEEKAAWAAEMQQASDFGAKIEEFADSLSDSAANDLAKAKAGLGELGQAGIDVLNNMVGMGMDAALSPLTGGSTLAAMYIRTFGGAAAEARKNGADPLEQLGYGVTDAAIEVLTEKMGDGLAGFYGAGASDELANSIINRLTDSTTGRALLNILYSSYEEGAEEVVSDLLHPLAERIYNDQAIKDLLENGYDLDQLIYDYLIGATIGTIGGVSSSATGEGGAMGDNVTEVLASAAAPEQSRPGIRQAPGMEIGQEADGGEGKPFSPADTLAEAATPTAEDERKTSGEGRAEEEAPKESKTPDELLAEASQLKADEERKTTGEDRAEEKAPEAPKEKSEEEAPEAEESPEEGSPEPEGAPVEEAPTEETPAGEETPAPEGEQPEQPKAEGQSPADTLAEIASGKTTETGKTGERAEGPSEAAESKIGSDHESVPEGTQDSKEGGSGELNNDTRSAEEARQEKQQRISDADEQIRAEADALSTEFEQDPVNVQRFQDGQGTYGQYDVQTRLAVLQHLFPSEDYYLSGGNIVKGRKTTANGDFDSTTGQSTTFGDTRTGSNHKRPKMRPVEALGFKGPSKSSSGVNASSIKTGDSLTHKTWGNVTVTDVNGDTITVKLGDGSTKRIAVSSAGDVFTGRAGSTKAKPQARGAMTYAYGDSGNAEVKRGRIRTTFDAIKAGVRTATTRFERHGNIAYWKKLKAGDVVEFHDKNGNTVQVRVTVPLHNLGDGSFDINEWCKKEGWSKEWAEKNVVPYLKEAWQFEYELLSGQTASNNGTIKAYEQNGGTAYNENSGERQLPRMDTDPGTREVDSRQHQQTKPGRQEADVGRNRPTRSAEETEKLRRKVNSERRTFREHIVDSLSPFSPGDKHGEVIDVSEIKNANDRAEWERALDAYRRKHPGCDIVLVRYGNFGAARAMQSASVDGEPVPGAYTIVADAQKVLTEVAKDRANGFNSTVDGVLEHEHFHNALHQSGYTVADIFDWLDGRIEDSTLRDLLLEARERHRVHWHKNAKVKTADALWEEVYSDLYAGINRAFAIRDSNAGSVRVEPSGFQELHRLLTEFYDSFIQPELDYREGNSAAEPPSNPNDPGANKSYGESLKANDPGEAPETGERSDDDMTPLNEQSREQDEKRREQAKADTKKRMGRENHERMTKALDKLDGFAKEFTERYGEVETDEHGGIVEDKDGNAVKNSVPNDVAKRLRSMLEGEETVQSFREYYESLRPAEGESSQTDSNFFYDGALAETLSQFADAERELIYAEKGGPANAEKAVQFGEGLSKEVAKENYDKAAEAFALSLGARLGHLQRNFENKVKFNGEVEANAKEEKSGLKGMFGSLSDSFWRTQMRVDTFLKSLVGFSGKAEVANDLAQRAADSTIKRNNVRNGGREFFRKLAKERKARKALADFEAGKTKGNVNIPGLGKVSMDYEVAVLKTLMTNGALDHIARFGAQFLNETDYRKGTNNNGRGDTEGYKAKHRITREALDQMAKDSLAARDEKLTGKAIYKEKISILKSIRAELMRDVNADPTAKAVYDASVEAMKYLAGEINDTTLRLYGLAKALQGSTYWPMTVYGRGNNLQFINNQAFTLEDASYLQHRRGGSGALFIAPFTETMDNYINRASKFVGFGELNSDLLMMSKEMGVGHGEHDAEKQSIQSVISKIAGEKAADYMRRYVELLNGQNRGPSKIGSTLRGNLAKSSLIANPGVAIKQTASYMNAAGIIDFDLLLKNRLVTLGGLRTARSYDNNALIQAINERTGMLKSRSADNTVELGEANSARELSNRLTKWMPNWLTNWIQTQDYKTIANLALACGEQVKRNHNGRIDTNSDAYYSEVAKLLEQVTAKTQPIYDAEFRAEYLRSDSEPVRMLAMFRTQQSQNLNNLMQAYGELSAAKREGGDVKAASRKVNQTVAGFVAAQTMFAVLSSAARMLLHKQKDYEDEDGNIDIGKVAKRLGLDFLESAAGVVWFGDTLAKAAVDAATGVYAKATGKKEAATQEFYQLSDNTISIVNNLLSSFLKAVKDPSAKNIKTAVFDASQATGIPARNLYNIANSAIMYYKDARRQNPENYDDIISLMEKRAKMTPAQRTKATANEAMSLFRKGEIDKGYALLATLDYSDRNVVKNTKTVAGQAYINGDIDEATYRRVLASTKITKSEIDKAVGSKSIDKTIAGLAKYDEDKYGSLPDEIENARANAGEGRSKSSAAARIIVDAAMSKNGQDAFMAKYTTPSYQKAFDAASKVKGVSDVVDALAAIDTNRNDSFTQKELYLYAQETGHDELVRAIWEANGWKTSYDTYRKNQAKKKG